MVSVGPDVRRTALALEQRPLERCGLGFRIVGDEEETRLAFVGIADEDFECTHPHDTVGPRVNDDRSKRRFIDASSDHHIPTPGLHVLPCLACTHFRCIQHPQRLFFGRHPPSVARLSRVVQQLAHALLVIFERMLSEDTPTPTASLLFLLVFFKARKRFDEPLVPLTAKSLDGRSCHMMSPRNRRSATGQGRAGGGATYFGTRTGSNGIYGGLGRRYGGGSYSTAMFKEHDVDVTVIHWPPVVAVLVVMLSLYVYRSDGAS